MKIIIKTTNIELTDAIRQYIEEKVGSFDKFLVNYDEAVVEARVEVGIITKGQRHGEIYRAEINLGVGGDLLRVEETSDSLYTAIDLAKDEMQREIKQYKDKSTTQYRRGARSWKKFWRISPLARFRKSKAVNIIKKK